MPGQNIKDCTTRSSKVAQQGGIVVFSYDGLGAGVTLIDFHIRRCHSIASGAGGIYKIGGASSFTMIRGSISGCSGRMVGGVLVSAGSICSFIDVQINDCHAFGTEYEGISGTTVFIGGGGILIGTGTLTMSGGAIRNCHAPHGNGGGINWQTEVCGWS